MIDGFKMTAVVTDSGRKIEINVNGSEYVTVSLWIIASSDSVFLDENGDEISKDDVKVAYTLVITCNG